jgi:hypothetical protein
LANCSPSPNHQRIWVSNKPLLGGRSSAHYYDPTVITEQKTFHIKAISTLFNLIPPAFPDDKLPSYKRAGLKSLHPQIPMEDMKSIPSIFEALAIRRGFGKIIAILAYLV